MKFKKKKRFNEIKEDKNKIGSKSKKYNLKTAKLNDIYKKILQIKFLENMSLKKQIILSFVLILCIPILIIVSYSYTSTRSTLIEKVKELNTQTTYQMNENFNNFLNASLNATYMISKDASIKSYTQEIALEMTEEEKFQKELSIKNALEKASTQNGFNDAFIIYENGYTLGYPQSSVLINQDKKELYESVKIESSKGYKWLTGYGDNYEIIFLAREVNDSAVLVTSQYVEKMNSTLKKGLNTGNQEIDIVNQEEMIIYSTNMEKIGQPISEYIESGLEGEAGTLSGNGSLVTFISSQDFKMLNSVHENYIFKEVNYVNSMIVIISMICLIVALLVAITLAIKIVKPIVDLVALMKKVEGGNFTVKSNYLPKNELGLLSASFNIMTENVKALIGNIIEVSDGIHKKADNIKSISKNSTVAAQQVSNAIEEIAVGASNQARQAEETLVTINSLAKSINEVTGSIGIVSESSGNTKEIGNGSLVKVKELEEKTNETDKTLNEITNTVITLVASLKNIEGFLEVINSISNQTNLLAINASIEAAHAGEYGKGFSVVAGEVKKLADQSRESTEEIAKVIKMIQVQTSDVNKLIMESSKIFKEQKIAVDYTSESFKDILLATDEITKEVGSVQKLVYGMNKYKENSMGAIRSISTVAEESSATTQEVMASTEEQANLSTELECLTENLYKEVNSLRSAIDEFKI